MCNLPGVQLCSGKVSRPGEERERQTFINMHAKPLGYHGYLLYMHTCPGLPWQHTCKIKSSHQRHNGYHAALVGKTEICSQVIIQKKKKQTLSSCVQIHLNEHTRAHTPIRTWVDTEGVGWCIFSYLYVWIQEPFTPGLTLQSFPLPRAPRQVACSTHSIPQSLPHSLPHTHTDTLTLTMAVIIR